MNPLVELLRRVIDRADVDRKSELSDELAESIAHRDIRFGDDLYLRRFFLTDRAEPERVFLHRIYRSDRDRHLHDHPFNFSTLILSGGYTEYVNTDPDPTGARVEPNLVRVGKPGMAFRNKAEHVHRLELTTPAWTILLVGQARRKWGFWTPTGWVYWRDYLGEAQTESESEEDLVRYGGGLVP